MKVIIRLFNYLLIAGLLKGSFLHAGQVVTNPFATPNDTVIRYKGKRPPKPGSRKSPGTLNSSTRNLDLSPLQVITTIGKLTQDFGQEKITAEARYNYYMNKLSQIKADHANGKITLHDYSELERELHYIVYPPSTLKLMQDIAYNRASAGGELYYRRYILAPKDLAEALADGAMTVKKSMGESEPSSPSIAALWTAGEDDEWFDSVTVSVKKTAKQQIRDYITANQKAWAESLAQIMIQQTEHHNRINDQSGELSEEETKKIRKTTKSIFEFTSRALNRDLDGWGRLFLRIAKRFTKWIEQTRAKWGGEPITTDYSAEAVAVVGETISGTMDSFVHDTFKPAVVKTAKVVIEATKDGIARVQDTAGAVGATANEAAVDALGEYVPENVKDFIKENGNYITDGLVAAQSYLGDIMGTVQDYVSGTSKELTAHEREEDEDPDAEETLYETDSGEVNKGAMLTALDSTRSLEEYAQFMQDQIERVQEAVAKTYSGARVKSETIRALTNIITASDELVSTAMALGIEPKEIAMLPLELRASVEAEVRAAWAKAPLAAIQKIYLDQADDPDEDDDEFFELEEKDAISFEGASVALLSAVISRLTELKSGEKSDLATNLLEKFELAKANAIQQTETAKTIVHAREAEEETDRLEARVDAATKKLSEAREATRIAQEKVAILQKDAEASRDSEKLAAAEENLKIKEAEQKAANREHEAAQEALNKHNEALREGEDAVTGYHDNGFE